MMLPNFLVSRATWLFFHRSLPQSSRVENVAVSLTRKFEHAQKEKKSIVFRSCPFSSPQPAVFWSRGLETRGSPLVRYKLYRVALERVWPILLPEPLGLICTKRNDGTVASRMGLQALVMLSLSLSLSEKSFIQWIALENPTFVQPGPESDTVTCTITTVNFRFLSS